MKTPTELTREELLAVVEGILEALFPNADPDAAWSPDTLDQVAAALSSAGLVPEVDEPNMVHCDHCQTDVPATVNVTAKSTGLHISDRDLATILAALRYWQQDLAQNEEGPISPEHFNDQITPLTVEEIDDLCERLNRGLM